MSQRKRYSPEFKREAIELVRRRAGFERHSLVEKKLFSAREAREMRNLLVSSVNWPE